MSREDKKGPIDEYSRKRDFSKTPEPPGKTSTKKKGGGLFIVQKHSARTLHYDLRLELGGVLKSWAVPKGPSLNPVDKRLAVRVEDHPIEYAGFEGIIPKGEYGAGTVLLWDRGLWVPKEDPEAGLRKGALKFYLLGRKLRGGFALVRTRRKAAGEDEGEEGKEGWLLIKEDDDEARVSDITAEEPLSVATGKDMDDVAASRAAVWSAKKSFPKLPEIPAIPGAKKAPMPNKMRPELPTLVERPPESNGWLHELKLDGYRILARLQNGRVSLFTRNANDWTAKFPAIAKAVGNIPVEEAWLDGEVVFLKEDGATSFDGLQEALSVGRDSALKYLAFDIVYFNGHDLSGSMLKDRKTLLGYIMKMDGVDKDIIRYSVHVEGKGKDFFDTACGYNVEGVVSKRADSPYTQARTRSWVTAKCHKRQEFVIGGFTEAKGEAEGLGALLLGYYDKEGRLIYCGRVGTGFNEKTHRLLYPRLKKLEIDTPPYDTPPKGVEAKGVKWVKPALVAEVAFSQWTRGGVLRQPSFKGLRFDKPPGEVVRERPQALKSAEAKGPGIEGPKRPPKARLTKPDKVLYPESGFTKRDLAEYYEKAAPLMLPHLSGRPLTLVRCPEGYQRDCFFQKHAGGKVPAGINRIKLLEDRDDKDTLVTCMSIETLEGLLGLVQMGTLEIHAWGSRYSALEYPDRAVFDIDPAPNLPWERLVEAAHLLRGVLKELKLTSFVKTTGGKGLHIVIPLEPVHGWDEVKAFTKAVAEYMARGLPGRFTSMMTKSRRAGKIFIDYMRNMRGATAIEAYSTRARAGAPVAAPVGWDELMEVRSDSFNIKNLPERIKKIKDPWKGYIDAHQTITPEAKRAIGLGGMKGA
ncbi:MAG: DNA ligase D [Deltaproteobacteria bacterium]|nr:DNA ligase D [Deltaproteobacteria bacterium]